LQAGASEEEIAAGEAALASTLANYERVAAGPSAEDIAAARLGLSSAQMALAKMLEGPSDDEIAAAKANVEQARIAVEQAQSEYDKVSWLGMVGALPQSLALQQATIAYEAAQAAYRLATEGASDAQIEGARAQVAQAEAALQRLLDSPTDAELAAAEAQVAQARSQLERLIEGASEEERRIAEAQVEQARVGLEQARLQLENTLLHAPFGGVIAEVNLEEGEQPSAALPAIVLIDDGSFHITVTVDELDITDVREGQEAEILLDALPDRTLSGQVVRISAGMSAAVDIVTAHVQDVLVIPNRAIQFDRRAGKTYVEKIVGTDLVRTEIQLGVQGEQTSEVRSGVEEGDQLAIRSASGLQQLMSTFGH